MKTFLKHFLWIGMFSFLSMGCQNSIDSNTKVVENVALESTESEIPLKESIVLKTKLDDNYLEELLFQEDLTDFVTYHLDQEIESDDIIQPNYVYLEDGFLEARIFTTEDGEEILAITNRLNNSACTTYESFLLRKNENGEWKDHFSDFFPNISLYSFYTLQDKVAQRFEGDEMMVFGGYHFELLKENKLTIQFMFCHLEDETIADEINVNGNQLIYSWDTKKASFE